MCLTCGLRQAIACEAGHDIVNGALQTDSVSGRNIEGFDAVPATQYDTDLLILVHERDIRTLVIGNLVMSANEA